MKPNRILSAALSATVLLASTSCSDFLNEYSQDMVVAKTVYHLDEVLLGDVYLQSTSVANGPAGTIVAGFFNILDDDVNMGDVGQTTKTWGTCTSLLYGYYAWQLRVGANFNNSYFSSDAATWTNLYSRINIINVILDEIVDMPHETKDDYAAFIRVQGESHFLRAWFYFTLANLYGDAYEPTTAATKLCVPLKLTASVDHDVNKDTQFNRATVAEIYAQIISDLDMAEKYLKESPQADAHRLHRASYEAVELLYSRVALYMQDWAKAEQKADNVIASSYTHVASLNTFANGPFMTSSNPEIIFSQGSCHLSRTDLFTGNAGDFCVTQELRDLYSDDDVRAKSFFGNNSLNDSITLTNKYERGAVACHISDVYTLRAAEAYLNKAEACSMQSGKEAAANTALNYLRNRRIENYTDETYSGAELVNAIRDERRRELCFEAHRWFDLRRYAVNSQYPYAKSIFHVFQACDDNGLSYTEKYELLPNDAAYTFALPESVIAFDKVPMEDNPRNSRKPIEASNQD